MDYKKTNAPQTTTVHDLIEMAEQTGNIYETVAILAKRANQIATEEKQELNKKIEEFASSNDTLEEVFENKEQIEVAKFYERLPKPTLIAIDEFLNDKLYYRNPSKKNEGDF